MVENQKVSDKIKRSATIEIETEIIMDRIRGTEYYVQSRWPNPEDAPKHTT